jgi:Icc protein
MKIVQITDLHVGKEGEDTFGIDVRANCINILQAVAERKPDYLVISGDLCYNQADPEIYAWIKTRVDQLGIPYEVIPGNHDDSTLLAQAYGYSDLLVDGQMYFTRNWGGQTVIFLDSCPNELGKIQLLWLEKKLQELSGSLIVFIHHPPVLADVLFMDRHHPLENPAELQRILAAYPDPIDVFCGHYHVDKFVHWGKHMIYLTPSGYFQINQTLETFHVDHERVGYREIHVEADRLITAVSYLEGTKMPSENRG